MQKVSICPVCQDWVLEGQDSTVDSAGNQVHLECAREHGKPAYRTPKAGAR